MKYIGHKIAIIWLVTATAAVLFLGSGCRRADSADVKPQPQPTANSDDTVISSATSEGADDRLGQYAINMMFYTSARTALSNPRKLVLAQAIVRITNAVFSDDAHKRAFIAAIAIESGFQRFAQSPTGPRGLSQVARKSFHEGLGYCGVAGASEDDVWEQDLNLLAGACYFRFILETVANGDPYVAVVAYNQGPNSKELKKYAQSGTLDNTEALKYVAKFVFLQQKVTDSKNKNGIPFVSDTRLLKEASDNVQQ